MARAAGVELVSVTKRHGEIVAVGSIHLTFPQGAYRCLLGPAVAARPRRRA